MRRLCNFSVKTFGKANAFLWRAAREELWARGEVWQVCGGRELGWQLGEQREGPRLRGGTALRCFKCRSKDEGSAVSSAGRAQEVAVVPVAPQ